MSIGGFHSIRYVLSTARRAGGLLKMWRSMRTQNACKTCALGMGGQRGGMVNEAGVFPEFCKKSVQAMAADMQGEISESFFEQYSIAQLSSMSPKELESLGRLAFPIFAGPLATHYKRITWEEAFDIVGAAMHKTAPDRSFYYCSGRSSNEAGFIFQLMARLRGTNHVNNCSYFCHQASGVGLTSVTGTGTATVQLEDLSHCDLLFLIGCNPSSNHPRLLKSLLDIRRRGGKVIVINPLKEQGLCNFNIPSDLRSLLFGSKISDYYVQPNIGGDAAFFMGILKWLHENNSIEEEFVEKFVDDFSLVRQQAIECTWDDLESKSGVSVQHMAHIASLYASSNSAVFCWAMGITHVKGGVDGVRMIANVALSRGMIGKKGAGLLPLRGHSNVQGMSTVGVVPELKGSFAQAVEQHLQVQLPKTQGFDTMAGMSAAANHDVDFALCLGGNLAMANPDTAYAVKSMSNIKNVAYVSTTLNQGHCIGRGGETTVFPVLARDEESQMTTQESMFNYVRRSSGGIKRIDGIKSEVQVLLEIASRGVPDFRWDQFTKYESIRRLIAQCVKGYSPEKEHQISGRTYHKPIFNTPSGRAIAHSIHWIPEEPLQQNELRLMTIRSEGQFNTVVYEEEDIFRGQTRRDIIMLNREDAQAIGVEENVQILVCGPGGELNVTARYVDISKGNCAMYFPEANILLSHEVDQESKTPLFKGTRITIHIS